jgi:hypothetical protein
VDHAAPSVAALEATSPPILLITPDQSIPYHCYASSEFHLCLSKVATFGCSFSR